MKKMSIRLAALVLPLVVSAVSVAGQELGDNATVILKEGTLTNMRQMVVIKSTPAAAASKVGNCGPDVRWQEAEVVDRSAPAGGRGPVVPPIPTFKTQAAIMIPGVVGFKDFKVGVKVGSWRDGGKCGPGFNTYLAHIIGTE